MTDMDRYEQDFAERLRAYSAPAARPPRREAVAVAVAVGREARRKDWLGLRWPTLRRLSMVAAGAGAVVLIAVGAVVLANLPRGLDLPPASLPKSPADWLRVELELPPGVSGIGPIGAGPRGLVAVTEFDRSGARRVLYSSDGRDWAEANVAAPRGEYVSVVATERGFLMTDSESGAWSSENGVDWQHVAGNWAGDPDAGGAIVVDAAAGGPGYVAVGNLNKIWHSTDGSTWVEADVPPPPADFIRPEYPDLTVDLRDVAASGEKLVAAGSVYMGNSDISITEDVVLVSNDGKSWSSVLPDIGDRAGALHLSVGPNGFLVIGGPLDGSTQYTVWQSADGETWQASEAIGFNARSVGGECTGRVRLEDVAATSAGYLAVGIDHECMDGDFPASPPRAVIWTSEDGQSWSRLADDEMFTLPDAENNPGSAAASVVAWDSRFVVGGMYAGEPTIWISGAGSSVAPSPAPGASPTAEASASVTPLPSATVESPLGIFEPFAGRIVHGEGLSLSGVNPDAQSPGSTLVRLDLERTGDSVFINPLGWSSDGSELLFTRTVPHYPGRPVQPPFDAFLYVLHADGTETQVTSEPADDAAISPDGLRVVFADDGDDDGLYVVDAEGGQPVRIANGDDAAISPDGLRVVFADSDGALYVVDSTGGQPVRIAEEAHSPTFSADGMKIAYATSSSLWVANADGSNAHQILADEPALTEGVFNLAWSPTSDLIAVGHSVDGNEAIYTVDPDGSDFTALITGGSRPFWSPDGSLIAYTLPFGHTNDDGEPIGEQSPRLAIANADGSNFRTFDFGESGPWHPGTPGEGTGS